MEIITQNELACYEKVEPPVTEGSNFRYSFSLLPKEERAAINSIYAFCSYIDDIVDSSPTLTETEAKRKMERLALWENVIENIYNDSINNNLLRP